MKLATDDHIICAYAEHASGPGWSNTPIWVIVRDARDGSLRQECIQPDEQTAEMYTLYPVSAAAHGSMTSVVKSEAKRFRRKR